MNEHMTALNALERDNPEAVRYGRERGSTLEEALAYAALYAEQGPEQGLEFDAVAADDREFAKDWMEEQHGALPPLLVVNWDATAAGILVEYTAVRLPGGLGTAYFREH